MPETEQPTNWQLHEQLSGEYARQREMRGGKTRRELVRDANTRKPRGGYRNDLVEPIRRKRSTPRQPR